MGYPLPRWLSLSCRSPLPSTPLPLPSTRPQLHPTTQQAIALSQGMPRSWLQGGLPRGPPGSLRYLQTKVLARWAGDTTPLSSGLRNYFGIKSVPVENTPIGAFLGSWMTLGRSELPGHIHQKIIVIKIPYQDFHHFILGSWGSQSPKPCLSGCPATLVQSCWSRHSCPPASSASLRATSSGRHRTDARLWEPQPTASTTKQSWPTVQRRTCRNNIRPLPFPLAFKKLNCQYFPMTHITAKMCFWHETKPGISWRAEKKPKHFVWTFCLLLVKPHTCWDSRTSEIPQHMHN